MFSQNNELIKPHIKPNKATKKLKSDQEQTIPSRMLVIKKFAYLRHHSLWSMIPIQTWAHLELTK